MSVLDPDQWQEVSPLLDQALTLTEEDRAHWLEALREQNPALAAQLQELLGAHRAAEEKGFLGKSPDLPYKNAGLAGQIVGAYRLISLVGLGGMGTVWLAERSDGRFERKAAVKFLSAALIGHGGEERFKREGAILGRFSHPNIAEMLDAGVTSVGQPYIILEYVEGEPIDRYCDTHRLDIKGRLSLFLDVLSAVAHAHASLIVHRDIKPSNVLVNKDGQVKLLDFGIAKLLEVEGQDSLTLITLAGDSPLTPAYAAPEQVTGAPITTATDVYALGVLLYQLISGQHPAGKALRSPAELVKAILDTEPLRPSTVFEPSKPETEAIATSAANRASTPEKLRRLLHGDLDTIVGKALKKNPEERYSSVTAMADDLRRYLKHEPISARPDTLRYRTGKFVRRNRGSVALVTVALVAVIAGATGTAFQARAARRQRDIAFRQLARAERVNDLNQFLLYEAGPSDADLKVGDLLDRAAKIVERENYSADPANHVELLISIGSLYIDKDEEDKARRLLLQAYQLSRELQEPSVRAKASCALAAAFAGGTEQARAKSLVAEGLRDLPNDPQFALDRAFCFLQGSNVATANHESRDALAQDQAAERMMDNSLFRSDYLKTQVLQNLAFDYADSEQGRAIAALERQADVWKDLGYDETKAAGSTFSTLAFFLNRAGRPRDAEHWYLRAREVVGEIPWWLESYADALRQLGRLDEAAGYADRACASAQKDNLRGSLRIRGRIYIDQNNLTRAEETLAKAESLVTESTPKHFVAELVSDRALLAQAEGKLPAALQLADEAVTLDEAAIQSGNEGQAVLPILLNRRAAIEVAAGQPDKAKTDADRSLSLLQASLGSDAFSAHIGAAQMARGRALLAQGESQEAQAAFRSAMEHFEQTLGPDHHDTRAARQLSGLTQ
jgi:eukaryotic-like serine/threonine-protein kinase